MNPHIQLFYDMMQECYGVNGWEYDQDLNIQFTNSKSPNLQKLLLLGFDRDKAILAHASNSDVPMIISDMLGQQRYLPQSGRMKRSASFHKNAAPQRCVTHELLPFL